MLPPQYQNDIPIYWQKVSFRCVVALLETFLFTTMKYNISINQYAAVTNGLNLDIVDLAIFDFIKDFANSPKCVKMQTSNGTFFWLSHKLIISELPLLGISTRQGVIKRINKLIDADLIVRADNCVEDGKSWYAFGANYHKMIFGENEGEGVTKVTPCERSLSGDCKQPFTPPVNNRLQNNIYNKDNNNKFYNIVAETDFSATSEENENSSLNQESGKLRGTTEPRKCLFENSRFCKFEDFEKCFAAPEFEKIDMVYYFNALADWSASKGRMQKNWIAQARNFIRGDERKGQLRLKPQYQTTSSGFNVQDMLDCMNDRY